MDQSNMPPKPNNYLVFAIISTVCCCMPTGIASIIYASKVNENYANGEYEMAEKNANNAKTWALVSLGIWVVGIILYI